MSLDLNYNIKFLLKHKHFQFLERLNSISKFTDCTTIGRERIGLKR